MLTEFSKCYFKQLDLGARISLSTRNLQLRFKKSSRISFQKLLPYQDELLGLEHMKSSLKLSMQLNFFHLIWKSHRARQT